MEGCRNPPVSEQQMIGIVFAIDPRNGPKKRIQVISEELVHVSPRRRSYYRQFGFVHVFERVELRFPGGVEGVDSLVFIPQRLNQFPFDGGRARLQLRYVGIKFMKIKFVVDEVPDQHPVVFIRLQRFFERVSILSSAFGAKISKIDIPSSLAQLMLFRGSILT